MIDAAKVIEAIDAAYVSQPRETTRSYIGASVIGQHCDAALAFALRGFVDEPPPPFLKRIFNLGHRLEDQVVRDLKAAGLQVMEKDPMTGKQWTYEAFEGHAIGHADGIIEDENQEVVGCEIKSMNQNSFDKFVSDGVAVSHPSYNAQMQMMMGISGIERFFFIAYCKNNSRYHAEIVEYNEFYWLAQKVRIERIMKDENIGRVSVDPESFSCSGCFKRGVCWGTRSQPSPACKHCKHSIAGTNAGWWCQLHKQDCSVICNQFERWMPKPKT